MTIVAMIRNNTWAKLLHSGYRIEIIALKPK